MDCLFIYTKEAFLSQMHVYVIVLYEKEDFGGSLFLAISSVGISSFF